MKTKADKQFFCDAIKRINGNEHFASCFETFLELALSQFCNNPSDRQQKLWMQMQKDNDFKEHYLAALAAYGDLAEDYYDPLGDMFMDMISHGQNGQFFTPDGLCRLMAKVAPIEDYSKIYDPACGSGRTLLAGLKEARKRGLRCNIFGNDLSYTCSKMTLLNLLINQAEGMVTCGDALLNDTENFIYFKIDKVTNLNTFVSISTYWQYTKRDFEEVRNKREKWWWMIAQYGWTMYIPETFGNVGKKEIKDEDEIAPETEMPKIEEKISKVAFGSQLSIFQ